MMDESAIGAMEFRLGLLHVLNARLPAWNYSDTFRRRLEDISLAQTRLNNSIYDQLEERLGR